MTLERRLALVERANVPRPLPVNFLDSAWTAAKRAEQVKLRHQAMDGHPAAMSTARLLAVWGALHDLGELLAWPGPLSRYVRSELYAHDGAGCRA